MNGALEILLKLAGIPDNIVQDLQKVAPEFADLVNFSKQIAEIAVKNQTLVQHVEQLAPVLASALPTLELVLPPAEEIAAYVAAKASSVQS